MKLSELQLGDWVYAEGRENPVQITALANDGSVEVNNEYYCTVEDLSPVELTQEIIAKNHDLLIPCRFDSFVKRLLWNAKGRVSIEIEQSEVRLLYCSIGYVHQLQNILHWFDINMEVVL
jgi:hypothetical protein